MKNLKLFRSSIVNAVALIVASIVVLSPEVRSAPALLPEGYTVESIIMPEGVACHVSGIDIDSAGNLWICTREGDIWKKTADENGVWQLFAEGLHEPCGLLVGQDNNDEEQGAVFVTQKNELSKIVDTNGDGVADDYIRVAATGHTSGNYHEFNHGLARDAEGNFYGTLNMAHSNYRFTSERHLQVHGAVMGASLGSSRGTAYKVTPAGKFEILAWGLRSPCGVGITADGKMLYTENQGDFMPTNFLAVVEKGQFYGHPAGLIDHPDYKGIDLNKITDAEWEKKRTMPAVWLPYQELANSPGQPVVDTTGGKFGPFAGQIFVGDFTHSNLMRCTLQEVKGQYQGFCIDFINHFRSGVVRASFHKDGSLWLGETGRGWAAKGDLPFGVEKVVWDGKTVPFAIKDIKHEKGGFRVFFTRPVAKEIDITKIGIQNWTYNFWATYGSPKVDPKTLTASELVVAPDAMSLFFKTEITPARVYDIQLPALLSEDGKTLSKDHGYYTLNQMLD